MRPFTGGDSRFTLTAGSVHSVPLGRRLGVVSISPHEVMVAFVGSDPSWTGGASLAVSESIIRGGLELTLIAIGKNLIGQRTAEFEVVELPTEPAHDAAAVRVQSSPA